MTTRIEADIAVIGAGSGGLSVAAGAAQLGRKVVLIEKGEMGGDCLNFGCVPSKALIAAATRAQSMATTTPFGVRSADPQVDFGAVMDHVQSVIAAIAPHDSQARFEGLGVTVIRAHGKFTGPRTLMAGDVEIQARHFVIATGSRAVAPPIKGLDSVAFMTNETIFSNRTRPDHLVVIGGGPIGAELAQAHRRLGSKVTLVEAETILGREDPEAVDVVRRRLAAEGVDIREKSTVRAIEPAGGNTRLTLNDGAVIEGTHLLVAAGRRANFDDLGLEAAGIERDGARLRLDDRLRTTNRRVYAIGDAAGGLQFTHVAGDHASTVIRNILFKAPAKRRDALAPRVTYCAPELASIGLTEAAARAAAITPRIARADFANNDRAQAERATEGFIKAILAKDGRILGATIVGDGAGDEIGLWAFAMANGLKIGAFSRYIAPYPTRGEISKRAAGAYFTPMLFSDRTRKIVKLLAMAD